jgi:hypothetical protein
MASDVSSTLAGLDALVQRVHGAVRKSVSDVAHLFQAQAIENAPVGDPDNSTNPPGDLRRGIVVEGPIGGDGSWAARVGPKVTSAHPGPGGEVLNYGRQREFGGEIYPRISSRLVFLKYGVTYHRLSVFQAGSHFLLRARTQKQGDAESAIAANVSVAVKGG